MVNATSLDASSNRPGKVKKTASIEGYAPEISSGKRIKKDAKSPAAHMGNDCRRLLYVNGFKMKKP